MYPITIDNFCSICTEGFERNICMCKTNHYASNKKTTLNETEVSIIKMKLTIEKKCLRNTTTATL